MSSKPREGYGEVPPQGAPLVKAERGKTIYWLYENGELWTTGDDGFFCGHVSDPDNLEYAIDMHEEELHWMFPMAQELG
jgi:hypothetical protein